MEVIFFRKQEQSILINIQKILKQQMNLRMEFIIKQTIYSILSLNFSTKR